MGWRLAVLVESFYDVTDCFFSSSGCEGAYDYGAVMYIGIYIFFSPSL